VRKQTSPSSPPAPDHEPIGPDSPTGCLVRLFWIAAGNLALLFLAVAIFQRGGFSALDLAFWAVVVALASARYADITRFQGRTTSGEPATMRHFRRYLVTMVSLAGGLWVGVHALMLLR